MAYTTKSYVDFQGLEAFLTRLKSAYAGNDGVGSTFTVAKAGQAVNDGAGEAITTKYLTVATAHNDYVLQTRVIGTKPAENPKWGTGYVDLTKDITADDLRGVLNVDDGAQVNKLEKIKLKGNGDASASALTIDTSDKSVTIDISAYALKSEVAKVMDYKGSKTAVELAAIKAGTITADMNGDVYTCSTESSQSGATDFKAGFEYVAVVSGTSTLTLDWVELGKNFTGMASESWVTAGFVGKDDYTNDKRDIQNKIDAIYKAASGDDPESGVLVTKIAAEALRASNAESALDGRLDILEGADTVTGSVAKSIKDAIGALDYGITGASGQQPAGDFVTGVTETDGVIAVTRAAYSAVNDAGTQDNPGNTPATALAVKGYVDSAIGDVNNAIGHLTLAQVGANNTASYVKLVSQSNGQVSAEAGAFTTYDSVNGLPALAAASDITAPTTKAVVSGDAAVYAAIGSVPLTGETNSISSLFGSST